MQKTKKEETSIGCSTIGRKSTKGIPHRFSSNTPWFRKCPQCGGTMFYGTRKRLNRAIRLKKICRSCVVRKRQPRVFAKLSDDGYYTRECPTCKKILTYKSYVSFWNQHIKNSSCVSCNRIGKRNYPVGFTHSEKSKETMRKAALRRVDNFGGGTNYNPLACQYMDSMKPEYNFQHALNGGEFRVCGYSVDGYDKEKNVVFEYDEPHHYKKDIWVLKDRDIKRMKRIKEHLGCTFLRYDERKGKIRTF